jgi:hypothetical protein
MNLDKIENSLDGILNWIGDTIEGKKNDKTQTNPPAPPDESPWSQCRSDGGPHDTAVTTDTTDNVPSPAMTWYNKIKQLAVKHIGIIGLTCCIGLYLCWTGSVEAETSQSGRLPARIVTASVHPMAGFPQMRRISFRVRNDGVEQIRVICFIPHLYNDQEEEIFSRPAQTERCESINLNPNDSRQFTFYAGDYRALAQSVEIQITFLSTENTSYFIREGETP